jgi:hypothetical protein
LQLTGGTFATAVFSAAIVEDVGDCLHFLIVGNSGIRINGT